MSDIVVFGSLNMDLVATVSRFPQPGETISASGFQTIPGGKGANQAAAAALLGGSVAMVGRVGQDEYGQALLENLARFGVSTDYVRQDSKEPTGIAMINIDSKGKNQIVTVAGANGRVSQEDIEHCNDLLSSAEIVVLQQEIPLSTVAYVIKQAANQMTILNAAPAHPMSDVRDAVGAADILVVNESEAHLLSGVPPSTGDSMKAGQALLEIGPEVIVVTLGEGGAIVLSAGVQETIPAPEVDVVDTTAAGDAFVGGLAVSLWEGKDMVEAVQYAILAGSLTVTKSGAQPSLPAAEDVIEFHKTLGK